MTCPMARVHVLSDLHLEFSSFDVPNVGADVVVLAGDIDTKARLRLALRTPGVMVSGNHESYGGKIDRTADKLRPAAATRGVTVLENEVAVVAGVRFLGCTLWTDFRLFAGDDHGRMLAAARLCADRMNDFRRVRIAKEGYRRFRPKDAAALHRASVAWLRERLAEPFDGPTVVVTHHAPSLRSVPPEWLDDLTTAAYASNLDWLVEESSAALWIHGHIHSSADYVIGSTRVICNPRGYWPGQPNPAFRPDLVVEV